MKTFKELMEAPGAPAADNKREKDDEKEVKGYKPRSKGEEDFASAHTVDTSGHPVATKAQFKGSETTDGGDPEEKHAGGKKHASGEDKPVMQGSSKVRESFSNWVKVDENGDD